MEITERQWQEIEDGYEEHQRRETARLGFVEIDLMDELKKFWRERGETDNDGNPI